MTRVRLERDFREAIAPQSLRGLYPGRETPAWREAPGREGMMPLQHRGKGERGRARRGATEGS